MNAIIRRMFAIITLIVLASLADGASAQGVIRAVFNDWQIRCDHYFAHTAHRLRKNKTVIGTCEHSQAYRVAARLALNFFASGLAGC
jgi:hypothetical protein